MISEFIYELTINLVTPIVFVNEELEKIRRGYQRDIKCGKLKDVLFSNPELSRWLFLSF
jgi:hypothetical protein